MNNIDFCKTYINNNEIISVQVSDIQYLFHRMLNTILESIYD